MKARASKKNHRRIFLRSDEELEIDFDEQEKKLNELNQMLSNLDKETEGRAGDSRLYSETKRELNEDEEEGGVQGTDELKKKEQEYSAAILKQEKKRRERRKASQSKVNQHFQKLSQSPQLNPKQQQSSQQEQLKQSKNLLVEKDNAFNWLLDSQSSQKINIPSINHLENQGAVRLSKNEIISDQNLSQVEKLSNRQVVTNAQLAKTNTNSNSLSIQASSDRLKDLLSLPSSQRTDTICENIAVEMKKVNFLSKYKEMPGFLEICRYLYVKIFEKKQFVFKQGEPGDEFYIILQGSVTIYIDEPTEYKSFMQLKEVAKLDQGDSFGEIALIYDSQRTATIIANERTFLIVLERSVFQTYIKQMKNQYLQKQVEFLECIEFFKKLKQAQIIELTTKLQMKTYTSNEIIGNEGETLPNVLFIRCGRAKVFKSIKFRINKYNKNKMRGDTKDPSSEEIANKQYISELVEIDELSDYSVIGDYSLLYSQPLDFTVVTVIPTEVYYVSSYDLIKIVPPDKLEKHRKLMKKYPNDIEIRQMYWEKREWESFQQNVISNLLIEKKNQKGFERLLKQPSERYKVINTPINVMDIQSSDNQVYIDLLSQKVPRGLQTKKNVAGLTPIYQSISQPNSSTAVNLWQTLKSVQGINPFSPRHTHHMSHYSLTSNTNNGNKEQKHNLATNKSTNHLHSPNLHRKQIDRIARQSLPSFQIQQEPILVIEDEKQEESQEMTNTLLM